MLDGNHEHIKWSADGTVIIITNSDKFQENELKKYLRTASYSSFVSVLSFLPGKARQLTYQPGNRFANSICTASTG